MRKRKIITKEKETQKKKNKKQNQKSIKKNIKNNENDNLNNKILHINKYLFQKTKKRQIDTTKRQKIKTNKQKPKCVKVGVTTNKKHTSYIGEYTFEHGSIWTMNRLCVFC